MPKKLLTLLELGLFLAAIVVLLLSLIGAIHQIRLGGILILLGVAVRLLRLRLK